MISNETLSLKEFEIINTNMATSPLPALAAIAITQGLENGNKYKPTFEAINTIDTARLAPELKPKTSGPANGFLKSVCICNPPTAKADPARIQVNAFVSLKFSMISFQTGIEVSFPVKALKISANGIETLPKLRFKKKSANSIVGSAIQNLFTVINIFILGLKTRNVKGFWGL
jgi:hypothetical protein